RIGARPGRRERPGIGGQRGARRPEVSFLGRVRGKLGSYRDLVRNLGLRAGLLLTLVDATMFLVRRTGIRPRHRLARVRLRGYEHPLWFRWFSSDPYVIRQIFSEREYESIAVTPEPGTIVDCGANIGCSAVWFLHRYRGARLICVEPDAGNVEVCRRNVAPWADRVEVIHAAVWSSHEPVEIVDGKDLEWAFRMQPATRADGSRVASVTMDDLVRRSPDGRVDVLKMDVEGAEREVFSHAGAWLDVVGNIAIELHGDGAGTFFAALEPYSYDLSSAGELTVLTDLSRSVR
ncbi:MAG: FkbM family methyltransferase, partial [Acidimicrobiales bacterium]